MPRRPMQTATTAAALACLALHRVSLLSSFARAGAIETHEDAIDHLIRRRNGASTSISQRPLHVQDGVRNHATVPDLETANDRKFYDMADWSNDDKQLLRNLLSRMEDILPNIDMCVLYDRYVDAIRQDGADDQQSPPPPPSSRRRRLMEEVDESAINDENVRLLRKKSDYSSTSKKKKQKKKGMEKWDDEATVNWAKRGGDNDKNNDSRKQKKSRNDSRKRKNSSNDKKRNNKKKRQNNDTGDDFYAKVAGKKKVTVSSDDKSRKSRKKNDSRKVDDHDYSDSDDKSNIKRQQKKTNGSRKKKASDNTTNKRIKSSFQPKFDESFRDSKGEVDIFKKKPKKQKKSKKKKKRARRLKSPKQTKDEGSSDDEYTIEPTSEPTYEPTYEDSLEECPEHYYYDSDDGNYYPDTQYHHSKSSKGAKSSKGSSIQSSQFKSAKSAIRRRELKSGKSQKGSKSSKASKGSSGSYDLTPCYPPGHGSDDDFEEYIPSRGGCDDGGDEENGDGVPCPSVDLRKVCDKYDGNGSFRECLEACEPSFCCIHDALSPPAPNSNYLAPNCNEDVNCAQYSYCYIAWWKLADTIGPAIYLRLEQNDDFFDVEADEIQGDQTGDPFYQQFMLHHFNDVDEILDAGTDANGDFKASTVFNDPDFWDTNI